MDGQRADLCFTDPPVIGLRRRLGAKNAGKGRGFLNDALAAASGDASTTPAAR